MNMLNIRGITKTYGNIKALDDINLSIKKGEFYGILGPNGAGKTTLMNIIVGFLESDWGSVELGGETITSKKLKIRNKIGYVPQEISVYLELTAEQNLKIFGKLFNIPAKELKKRSEEVLELVQLSERRNDAVKTYSGGMKRRLNLAVSLLHHPELILCDEPTVGVDPQSRNAIFDMLQKINSNGTTIIYTTHYMEEAERLCSKIAIMDNGKVISEGTLFELIANLNQKETIKVRKTSESSDIVKTLSGFGKVIEQDFVYELSLDEKYELNSDLLRQLEEKNIPLTRLEITGASLEDVFLTLTGRSLRD